MQVAYLLYDRFTALDITGPHDVLNSRAGQRVDLRRRAGRARSATSPTPSRWSPTPRSTRCTSPDIVVVPGGFGNRAAARARAAARLDPRACTRRPPGRPRSAPARCCSPPPACSTALPATTHWLARDLLAELGAKPVPDRVVEHGKIITAAGVSSGHRHGPRAWSSRSTATRSPRPSSSASSTTPSRPLDAGSPEKAPQRSSSWSPPPSRPRRSQRHARRACLAAPRAGRVVPPASHLRFRVITLRRRTTALIMAAGQGTRMRSSVPKVLHEVCGRPMVAWPILAAPRGRRRPRLRDRLARPRPLRRRCPNGTETIVQPEADGTGGALRAAVGRRPRLATRSLVLSGDHPLISRRDDRRAARGSPRRRRGRDRDDHRARGPGHLRPDRPRRGRRRRADRRGQGARRRHPGGARDQGGQRRHLRLRRPAARRRARAASPTTTPRASTTSATCCR